MGVSARVAWGVGLLAAAGIGLYLARPHTLAVQTARVVRSDLEVPVLCDGVLGPGPEGELRAPQAATIRSLSVRDGQTVEPGTELVRLDNGELAQKALEARAATLVLEQDLPRLVASKDEAERDAVHLRSVVAGDERLLSQGALARDTVEADRLALHRAEDRLTSARAELSTLAGTSGRLALARTEAGDLESRVAALTLRSPYRGVVYGMPRRAGEAVAAGQFIVGVLDPTRIVVRARVDQPDIPRVSVGQRFVVSFDGLPDRKWEGKVTLVSPALRDLGGRQVGEVLSEIADPELRLPPNASVNVQIIAGRRTAALVVPRAAIYRDNAARFSYVLESGRARRRDVSLGLVGLSDVEVVSGLAEGDRVILPGAVPIAPGMAVSPTGG